MERENDEMARITLRLPPNLKERIREQAKKEYRTSTGLILLAIAEYLEKAEKSESSR